MNDVKKLVNKYGFSKYKIASLVGVSWNTVSNWYKNFYYPNSVNKSKLQTILENAKSKVEDGE